MTLMSHEVLDLDFVERPVMVNRSTQDPTAQLKTSGTLVLSRESLTQVPANSIVVFFW